MKHLLSLLVLLAGFHLCSCDSEVTDKIIAATAPPSPPPTPLTPPTPLPTSTSLLSAPSDRPKPGFDYFVLSLTWPNAFCKLKDVTCRPSVPKQYFTIHGLWPQKKGQTSSPEYCEATAPLTDEILQKYKEKLLEFWPRLLSAENYERSKNLWYVQWNQHGSCSSNKFPPQNYIHKTVELGSKYGPLIMKELEDAGIKPDGTTPHSSEDILKAIKKATHHDAYITCDEDTSSTLQLFEIRLCVQADAENLQNCDRKKPGCKSNPVFASPPSGRSLSFPTFVSSVIKVEEAAGL